MRSVLCVILGGGQGTRLFPLTQDRSKPAVPLAGRYRLIDIPITNCINSGLRRIFVLTQFNSESLNRHISSTYKFDDFTQGYVGVLAAEQTPENKKWFQGTADAVRQVLRHMTDPRIEEVVILSGDHLYTMNIMDMVQWHRDKKSEITIACKIMEKELAPRFGVMGIDKNYRINKFEEKPPLEKLTDDFVLMEDGKESVLASMGIYVFNFNTLKEALLGSTQTDFGKGIIISIKGFIKIVIPHDNSIFNF